LSNDERVWLNNLYQSFQTNKKAVVPHIAKRNLASQLSPNFDYQRINPRVASHDTVPGGSTITLLGIWTVDHNTEWVGKVDLVLRYIQQIIRQSPQANELQIVDIASKLYLSPADVSAAIDLAQSCKINWVVTGTGHSAAEDDYPKIYQTIQIGNPPNAEKVFQFYDQYNGIGDEIRKFDHNPIVWR
jgi:hypothetical protein